MASASNLSLHVTFGGSKKLLSCTTAELSTQIESLFKPNVAYDLQVWDDDFSDWVDIEDITTLNEKPKWKLNIVLRSKPNSVSILANTQSTDELDVHSPADDPSPTEGLMPSQVQRQFPMLYTLPRFPDHLQRLLDNRDPICRKDDHRKKILRVLFDDLLQYGIYPGSGVKGRGYNDACRELVTKYEFLRDRTVLNGSNYHSWMKRLTDKFKKYRSRTKDLSQREDIATMKQRHGRKRSAGTEMCDTVEPESLAKVQRVRDILEPPEDDVSMAAHLVALQRECKKSSPSSIVIEEKMTRTLSHRSKMVQEKRVSEVLDTYPCLRIEKEILSEGERTFKISVNSLRTVLCNHVEKIEKAVKGKAVKSLQQRYQQKERTGETDTIYAAMLLVVSLSDQPLVFEGRGTTAYPHVECSSDDVFETLCMFTVFVDGVEITSCQDIVTAITACFIMYWVFDIKYPKPFYGMLSMLDTFVFRKNSVKATQKVLNFVNQI